MTGVVQGQHSLPLFFWENVMGIFGWSYPPGCSSTPYDEDYPCDVCGEFEDTCICPECTQCGSIGDPKCYTPGHHVQIMTRSAEQVYLLAWNEAIWENDNRSYNPNPEEVF